MMDLAIDDVGAAEFLAETEALVPKSRRFALDLGNAVRYAVYLQNRHGYFVISDEHLVETVGRFLARIIERDGGLTDAAIEDALMEAAAEEVAYLTTFISEMRPPLAEGEPSRPARRGRWADRTTDLVNGFYARVGNGPVRRFPVPSVAYQGKKLSRSGRGRRLAPGGHNQPHRLPTDP